MVKKIVLGTLLVGLIGILVAGAIIRTVDKTENVAEAQGLGYGRGNDGARGYAAEPQGEGFGAGRRGGYGQEAAGSSEAGRQYPNYEEGAPEEWVVYEGTVVQSPASGVDLVVRTDDGEELTVGTGPGYMEAQGFVLQDGERVQVQGYWEDDELKAAQVTRLRDGQTITLRDEYGRPAWAGSGKRAVEQQAAKGQGGQGQGQGGQGQGQGQGGRGQGQDAQGNFSGEGREGAPGDGDGTGQAQVEEWLAIQGTVVSVGADALVVQTASGEEIAVERRAWWFAQEEGFSAQAGDEVTLAGFYEGDEFEVGKIENMTSGQVSAIREESGRPLWAGRGRRGG